MKESLPENEQSLCSAWETHIQGWRSSGQNQIEYCSQEGLDYFQFRKWSTELNKKKSSHPKTLAFSLVKQKGKAEHPRHLLQINFPNRTKIMMPCSWNKEHLQALLQVIGGLTCSD